MPDTIGRSFAGVQQALAVLTERRVLVGVPAATAPRQGDDGRQGPINNAALGYIQEFGSPEANIPARPFLVPGVRNATGPITDRLKIAAQAALRGADASALDRQLHAIGITARDAVQQEITDGQFVPLAPSTIANRRRRGRTGDKPLIDTGQLRQAITYVVEHDGTLTEGGPQASGGGEMAAGIQISGAVINEIGATH